MRKVNSHQFVSHQPPGVCPRWYTCPRCTEISAFLADSGDKAHLGLFFKNWQVCGTRETRVPAKKTLTFLETI
jgi:hypothetical protein